MMLGYGFINTKVVLYIFQNTVNFICSVIGLKPANPNN